MQIKKDMVKDKIMAAATKEFLKSGFKNASLRNIAARAGVTKGNIYTYFENKNALFCSIVAPVMSLFKDDMEREYSDEYIMNWFCISSKSLESTVDVFTEYSRFIQEKKAEIKLLFFCSSGSEYETYREDIFRMHTDSSRKFYKRWSELNPECNFMVSEMLMHSQSAIHLSFIEEIIIHDPAPTELKEYIKQMAAFMHFGVGHVMRNK